MAVTVEPSTIAVADVLAAVLVTIAILPT